MARLTTLTVALLLSALCACSDADPKELIAQGQRALGANDPATALEKFTEAAGALKPEDPMFVEAQLGCVEAKLIQDPKGATAQFVDLATRHADRIDEKVYISIGGQMISARHYLDAIDLVDSGIKRFGKGESPALVVLIERIKKEAASDSAVSDKLKGLGYM